VDDGEHLPGRVQSRLRQRAPHGREEIEGDEVQVLVQRLEGGDLLLVDADPVVRLAHPHLDVEVAVERLLVGGRLAAGRLHDVVVHPRQHLALVVVPEPLGVGLDARVDGRPPADRRGQPARRDFDPRPTRELLEVLPLDDLGAERGPVHHAARGVQGVQRVDVLRAVHQLHGEGAGGDAEVALEDLVHRVQLVQPPRGHRVELVLLRQVRLEGGDPQADRPGAAAPKRGDDLLGQPRVALLVGAQDADARVDGSGLDELLAHACRQLLPELERLAEARLHVDVGARPDLGEEIGPDLRPELVHLPGDLDRVLEDRVRVGDPRAGHADGRRRAKRRLHLGGELGVEGPVPVFQEQLGVERLDRLSLEVVQCRPQLLERLGSLSGRASGRQELRGLRDHVLVGGGPAPDLPEVGHPARQVLARRHRARRIRAGDDGGRGVPERARHDLDHALPGLQVVEPRLPDLDQLLDERVAAADEDGARFVAGLLHPVVPLGDGQGDARGVETEPGRDVRRAQRVLRPADDDRRVGAIGNQVLVGVAVPAVERVGVAQVECPSGREPGFDDAEGVRFRREFVRVDRRGQRPHVHARSRDRDGASHPAVHEEVDARARGLGEVQRLRPLAPAVGGVHALERGDRPGHVGRGEVRVDPDDGDAAPFGVHGERDDMHNGRSHAVGLQEAGDLLFDGAEGDARHRPQPRHPGGEFHGGGERAGVVAPDDGDARRAPGREGDQADEALAGSQRRQVERALVGQPPDVAIPAADENREGRGVWRRAVVTADDGQGDRGGLPSEAGGDVGGRLDVVRGRLGRHDDPRDHLVGKAVAVGVAHRARPVGEDARQRLEAGRARGLARRSAADDCREAECEHQRGLDHRPPPGVRRDIAETPAGVNRRAGAPRRGAGGSGGGRRAAAPRGPNRRERLFRPGCRPSEPRAAVLEHGQRGGVEAPHQRCPFGGVHADEDDGHPRRDG
jgi:hypothetical protein